MTEGMEQQMACVNSAYQEAQRKYKLIQTTKSTWLK